MAVLRVWNGTEWVAVGGSGTDTSVATDPIFDAAGDLVVGTGANTAARLAKGSNNQVLTVVGGTLTWATPGSGGVTVREVDTAPSVAATVLEFPNGTLTDQGSGVARYTPAAGGSGWSPGVTSVIIQDDFMFTNPIDSGIGTINWMNATGATPEMMYPEVNHPGIIKIKTSTTSNNYAYISMGGNGNGFGFHTTDMFDTTWIVRPNHADANTIVAIGIAGMGSDYPMGGYVFERNVSEANWWAVSRTFATNHNRQDTGVAFTVGTWYKLRIRRIDASTVGFTINGGTELTTTTFMTNAASSLVAWIKTTAAAQKTIEIDYADLKLTVTR
jgi:hypothetical protein